MVFIHSITALDQSILHFIQNNMQSGLLDWLMPKITVLGNAGAVWLAAAVLLLFFKKRRKQGLVLLAALALCYITGNLLLKPLVGRIRPCNIDLGAALLIPRPGDLSFPSGHTMASFAAAGVIAQLSGWKTGAGAYLLAGAIAFSRLYLYVHYPSDVFAGMLIGTALALLCVTAYKRLSQTYSQ